MGTTSLFQKQKATLWLEAILGKYGDKRGVKGSSVADEGAGVGCYFFVVIVLVVLAVSLLLLLMCSLLLLLIVVFAAC
jgi:hypothetical protein